MRVSAFSQQVFKRFLNGPEILVRGKLVQVSSQLLEIALAVAITIKDIVSVNNDIYPAGRTTYHRGSGRIGILYREFWGRSLVFQKIQRTRETGGFDGFSNNVGMLMQ